MLKCAAQLEKSVSEQQQQQQQPRRPRRRRRKAGGLPSPNPAAEAGTREAPRDDDANGAATTRSGAAGAAHMLQLAVGRSPVRARRPSRTPGGLTDASLAAFDLSPGPAPPPPPPDLDDTATASAVPAAGHLLAAAAAADFSHQLPQFDLQT